MVFFFLFCFCTIGDAVVAVVFLFVVFLLLFLLLFCTVDCSVVAFAFCVVFLLFCTVDNAVVLFVGLLLFSPYGVAVILFLVLSHPGICFAL